MELERTAVLISVASMLPLLALPRLEKCELQLTFDVAVAFHAPVESRNCHQLS